MASVPGLPRPAYQYSFARIQCVVGGIALSQFGDDGGVEFEYGSELVEASTSADGFRTYTSLNDESVKVTITLRPHSPAVALLDGLVKAQMATLGLAAYATPVPFLFIDPSTGSQVASEYCIFMSEPTQSAMKSLGERIYVLDLPYARFKQLFSPKVSGPVS